MRLFLIFLLMLSFVMPSGHVMAQENKEAKSFADEGMDDLVVVAGIGAGGALLGLSTLSFVKEPKDHTDKVITGAAIGIIIGVIVVAVGQADKAQTRFQDAEAAFTPSAEFSTHERIAQSVKVIEFDSVQFATDLIRFHF